MLAMLKLAIMVVFFEGEWLGGGIFAGWRPFVLFFDAFFLPVLVIDLFFFTKKDLGDVFFHAPFYSWKSERGEHSMRYL